MKLNFKILCAVGSLLCMGSVYAMHNVPGINESSERLNARHVTFEEFEKAPEENLPQNMIMEKQDVLIDDSNIDRLIKFADRIILEDCDVVSYMDKEPAEKLRTLFSKVFPKSSGINYLSFGCHDVTSILNILKEVYKLPYLRNLEFFDREVEDLPEEVWSYVPKDVEFVNFSSTSVRNLPEGINRLQNLEKLYFYTPIEDLPKDIESLPNLKEVILPTGHELSVTRFLENSADIEHVESLDLSNKRLDRVPYDIVRLKSLKELNLCDNHLKSIPRFLRNMENLETLDISANGYLETISMEDLPDSLKKLTINGFLLKDIPDNRIKFITNMDEIGSELRRTNDVVDFVLDKSRNSKFGNKQMMQKLGGICIVELKESE